ncbi:MAG: substrate-binding domain-containing protein [Gemmataceae bacterium]
MNSPLPKYLQISQEIEYQINSGHWENGKIPSVRGIAAEHNVSVVTASRALQVLRDKGLINAVERSGCYLVPRDTEANEKWALFWRVTPGPWQQATGVITQRGFDAIARQERVQFDASVFDFGFTATDREIQRQVRTARENGITGVFYMPSRFNEKSMKQDEVFLKVCDSVGLAVVLIERNLLGRLRPLTRDLVASDDLDGGRQSTNHLLDQGRTRIACITGSKISCHEDRVAGYYHALLERGADEGVNYTPQILWQSPEIPSKDAYSRLADELLGSNVDGVICYQDYTAIGLILELLSRGVRVPADIAIVGFDDLPIGNMFAIGVTTYAFPSETIASQAVRLMRERIKNPETPALRIVVPGNLIIRESTGVPPKQHQTEVAAKPLEEATKD